MPFVGHVNPGLPVARRLIERGHEARWYTGRRFRERVEATGAGWEPMRAAYDFDDRDLEASFTTKEGLTGLAGLRFDLKHVFIDPIPGQIADLRAILREYPADAILADFTMGGVSLLHQLGEGRPWAALGHNVVGFKSRDTAPFGLGLDPSSSPLGRLRNAALDWALNRVIFRDVNAHANAMRARLGLPTTRQGIFGVGLSPFLHLQATVPAFEYPRGDLPSQLHFIGPLLPPPAADFSPPAWWDDLRRGRPVVHVTQGTVATD